MEEGEGEVIGLCKSLPNLLDTQIDNLIPTLPATAGVRLLMSLVELSSQCLNDSG